MVGPPAGVRVALFFIFLNFKAQSNAHVPEIDCYSAVNEKQILEPLPP